MSPSVCCVLLCCWWNQFVSMFLRLIFTIIYWFHLESVECLLHVSLLSCIIKLRFNDVRQYSFCSYVQRTTGHHSRGKKLREMPAPLATEGRWGELPNRPLPLSFALFAFYIGTTREAWVTNWAMIIANENFKFQIAQQSRYLPKNVDRVRPSWKLSLSTGWIVLD